MPTTDEWFAALTVPRRVDLNSDAGLVATITQKQADRNDARHAAGKPRVPVKGVTAVALPANTIDITPANLLHAIGLATTPLVPNLTALSSTWALLRYIWAFQLPNGAQGGALRLSDTARKIDFHQKGLLSDEIGVGMGCLLMSHLFGTTSSVDVSIAVNDPNWGANLTSRLSPDFLCFDPTQQTMVVLECKGNQSSRSGVLDQLARGTEQLPSLRFANRPPPPGYVVATHLRPYGTTVYLLDPPGSDDADEVRNEMSVGPKAEKGADASWRILDDERFLAELQELEAAKLASFIGDGALAFSKLPLDFPERGSGVQADAIQTQVADSQGKGYTGMATRAQTSDGKSIEVFKGLSDTRLAGFRHGAAQQLTHAHSQLQHGGYKLLTADTANAIIVESVSPEDTLLRFSIAK